MRRAETASMPESTETLVPAAAEAHAPDEPRTAARGPRARVLGLAFWTLVVALVGLNVYLWWRERPPAEDVRTIRRWIAFGRYDDADRALRALLRYSPNDGEARLMLGKVRAAKNDLLGCARELHLVPAWWPKKPEAAFYEAEAYKALNRARDAEAAWKVCFTDDPLHPTPTEYLGRVAQELVGLYVLEDRIEEARAIIWKSYELAEPIDHPQVLIMRVRVELERIAHDEALAKLTRYAEADPGDWEAVRGLARVHQLMGHAQEARRLLQACVKARPENAHVWHDWLELLHEQGDKPALRAAIAHLPASTERDAGVWKFRGMDKEWSGDLPGAAEAYRQAIKLKPDEGEYHYKLAQVEQRLGRADQAERERKRNSELKEAHSALADAYEDYIGVIKGKTGAEQPDLGPIMERLAKACDTLGWSREAEAWRKLLAPEPARPAPIKGNLLLQ